MNTKDRSFICKLIKQVTFLAAIFTITACQVDTKREDKADTKPLVDPKYSLAQDRTEYDQLRESIPEAKRKSNDEKALLAEWMIDYRLSPSQVREKYEILVRKKRESFNKDLTKIREDYTKAEKKKRDEVLKDFESQRASFTSKKKTQQDRNDFYNDLDGKRKNYFSEEHEKRDEFESSIRDQRKNFEDYLNEKRLDFTSAMKGYTDSWNLKQKEVSK
ncbi:MAG: hypothetical protein WA160_00175 [Pseudobdellovibrio sp.]